MLASPSGDRGDVLAHLQYQSLTRVPIFRKSPHIFEATPRCSRTTWGIPRLRYSLDESRCHTTLRGLILSPHCGVPPISAWTNSCSVNIHYTPPSNLEDCASCHSTHIAVAGKRLFVNRRSMVETRCAYRWHSEICAYTGFIGIIT